MTQESIKRNALAFLIGQEHSRDFLAGKTVEKAYVIPSNGDRKAFLEASVSAKALLEAAAQTPLHFGRDVYVGSDAPLVDDVQALGKDDIDKVLKSPEAWTIMLTEPQRFLDGLWLLISGLEAQTSTLVSCVAHMAGGIEAEKEEEPEKKEKKKAGKKDDEDGDGDEDGDLDAMLANLNSDMSTDRADRDIIFCQAAGSSKWEIGRSKDDSDADEDEDDDMMDLFDKELEVELKAGESLVVPAGCFYRAKPIRDAGKVCAFIEITMPSTGTIGQLVHKVLTAVQNMDVTDPTYIKPLPLRLLGDTAMMIMEADSDEEEDDFDGEKKKPAKKDKKKAKEESKCKAMLKQVGADVADALRALADQVETEPAAFLSDAIFEMAQAFAKKRLPPHEGLLLEKGPEPTMNDSLVVRGQGMFDILPVEDAEGDDEDEDDEDDEDKAQGFVAVATPVLNARSRHMVASDSGDDDKDKDDDDDDDDNDDDEDEEKEKKEGGKEGGRGHHACHHKHHDHDHDDDSDDDDDDDKNCPPGPIVPATYVAALHKVLTTATEPGVAIKDLVSLVPHKDETEVLNLVSMLYEEGYVKVIPGTKAAAASGKGSSAGKKGDKQQAAGKKRAADAGDNDKKKKKKA